MEAIETKRFICEVCNVIEMEINYKYREHLFCLFYQKNMKVLQRNIDMVLTAVRESSGVFSLNEACS